MIFTSCAVVRFSNPADFGETMDMLEEYGYLRRETIPAANGCNRAGIMVYINPHIHTQ